MASDFMGINIVYGVPNFTAPVTFIPNAPFKVDNGVQSAATKVGYPFVTTGASGQVYVGGGKLIPNQPSINVFAPEWGEITPIYLCKKVTVHGSNNSGRGDSNGKYGVGESAKADLTPPLTNFLSGAFSAAGAVSGAALGGVPGSVVGAGMGSGIDTNEANAQRADSANAWSAAQYGSRYQTMVNDLTKAGLNPMLAYSQSPGTAPSAQQVTFQNPASAATQGFQQVGSAQQANAEVEKTKHMNEQIDATVDKIGLEMANLKDEGQRIRMTSQMLSAQATLMAQQGATQQEMQAFYKASASKLRAEGKISWSEYDAIVKTGGIGRIAREVKPISDIGSDWVSPSKWFKK